MVLFPPEVHPHGISEEAFRRALRRQTDVVMAFHGYARRPPPAPPRPPAHPSRFHVRGFNEQGTTTTPFDMVVLNRMSRYHLVLEALQRARRASDRSRGAGRALPTRCSPATRPTSASTSRTCPRFATGPGSRPEPVARTHGRILAVNVGSSSLKLRVLDQRQGGCERRSRLHLDGDEASSRRRSRRSWPRPLRSTRPDTGWSTAAPTSPDPSFSDGEIEAELERLADLAPLHNPPALAAIRRWKGFAPSCRRSPASTPPFTRRSRRRRRPMPSRAPGRSAGRCAATASTASPMPMRAGGRQSCSGARLRSCGWSPPTSAPAPRWPRCSGGKSVERRWASLRWRGW